MSRRKSQKVYTAISDPLLSERFFMVKRNTVLMMRDRGYEIHDPDAQYLWTNYDQYGDALQVFLENFERTKGTLFSISGFSNSSVVSNKWGV